MKRKIIFVIYITFILLSFINIVNADDISNLYDPLIGNGGDANKLYTAAGIIISAIKWGGVMVCTGMLIYKGIKLMIVSPDGKAEIKKEMITWTIGTIILFSFTTLIGIIQELVNNANING